MRIHVSDETKKRRQPGTPKPRKMWNNLILCESVILKVSPNRIFLLILLGAHGSLRKDWR